MEREEFIANLVEEFNAGTATLSYTALSRFKQSPRSFIDYKMKRFEPTDAMKLGTLVHCLTLQPEEFEKRYIIDKEICEEIGGAKPRATKAYKEWVSEQTGEIIKSDDYETAKIMANAVLNNSAAKHVLSQVTEFEKHVQFEHNGLKFNSFIDGLGSVITDLKICADASPDKFRRTIINDGYYLQGSTYEVAIGEVLPFYNIAVDRSGGVSVHELEENLIDYGMNEFNTLTLDFLDCLKSNSFHQSFEYRAQNPRGIFNVPRPPWM